MRLLVIFVIATALVGCVTAGTSSNNYYQPQSTDSIKNSVIVDKSFDIVWDRLVEQLATGFFVINNIDKSSRFINLSFSTSSPEEYVDCGQTQRHFEFRKENRDYEYAVAADAKYKATGRWGPYNNLPAVYDISRDTGLEGRINVYVSPLNSQETKVSVNTKYVFTVDVTGFGTGYNAFGSPQSQERLPSSNSTVSFTTQQEQETQLGGGATLDPVVCRAIGRLEQSILAKVEP